MASHALQMNRGLSHMMSILRKIGGILEKPELGGTTAARSSTVYSQYYGQNSMGTLGIMGIFLGLPPLKTDRPSLFGCSAAC
jgi:hypothetical protein